MADGQFEQIPWEAPEGMALGRNIRHDPRNRRHALPRRAAPTSAIRHRNYGRKLNQGDLGACTGFAGAHCLNFSPLRQKVRPKATCGYGHALDFYRGATRKDPFPGEWEPDDTGSSGQGVCEAMVEWGFASGYKWAFGYDHGLEQLAEGPLMIGTWWYEEMFFPDRRGMVQPKGRRSGGHETLWVGHDPQSQEDLFLNNWSPAWGLLGYFRMKSADTRSLIDEQDGDLVRPVIEWAG